MRLYDRARELSCLAWWMSSTMPSHCARVVAVTLSFWASTYQTPSTTCQCILANAGFSAQLYMASSSCSIHWCLDQALHRRYGGASLPFSGDHCQLYSEEASSVLKSMLMIPCSPLRGASRTERRYLLWLCYGSPYADSQLHGTSAIVVPASDGSGLDCRLLHRTLMCPFPRTKSKSLQLLSPTSWLHPQHPGRLCVRYVEGYLS